MPKSQKEDVFREILVNTVEGARRLRHPTKIIARYLEVPLTTAANWVYNNRTPGPWRELAALVSFLLDKEAVACQQISVRIRGLIGQYDEIAQRETFAGTSAERREQLCEEAMTKLDWRTAELDRDWAEARSLHRQALQEQANDKAKKVARASDWNDPDEDRACPA